MPTKRLPKSANLAHLKHQAKDLLKAFRAEDMSSFQRVREFHPKLSACSDQELGGKIFSLSDAQLCIAREYGYTSWPRIKEVLAKRHHEELTLNHNDRIPDGAFKQALDFMDAGEAGHLEKHLSEHPELIHETVTFEGGNYFRNPTLLEFLPENPNRIGSIAENALDIAKILLAAGANKNKAAMNETLMLAASGRVCREAGLQSPLIRLLCKNGADPNAGMEAAQAHLELASVRTMIDCGARFDLVAAATLGETAKIEALLPEASQDELQLALSLSANTDRGDIVKTLIDAGADPNRYNPPGGHSHCTPLHSAVASNQMATVAALLLGGANVELKDIHHNMTPLQWAEYLNFTNIQEVFNSHFGIG